MTHISRIVIDAELLSLEIFGTDKNGNVEIVRAPCEELTERGTLNKFIGVLVTAKKYAERAGTKEVL